MPHTKICVGDEFKRAKDELWRVRQTMRGSSALVDVVNSAGIVLRSQKVSYRDLHKARSEQQEKAKIKAVPEVAYLQAMKELEDIDKFIAETLDLARKRISKRVQRSLLRLRIACTLGPRATDGPLPDIGPTADEKEWPR